MRYGFVLPGGDATVAAELAAEAEQAGWDGFFCWEAAWAPDAWVSLAAAAMRTTTLRLGTMLTPLPRMKPWDVASRAMSVDRLSGGRVILSVGLGAPDARFSIFEEDPGRKIRAERLDEGLEMFGHLWKSEPFTYDGKHYQARRADMMIPPPPIQQPRIPIWVVGLWPSERSMSRVARWDGWLPNFRSDTPGPARPDPAQLAEGVAWLREERAKHGLSLDGFDVITEGTTEPGEAADAEARRWIEAGATWYLEANWALEESEIVERSRERLRAGPPRP